MAQSFSNQVLILLKKNCEEIQILLHRQPKRVHAMTVTPVGSSQTSPAHEVGPLSSVGPARNAGEKCAI